MNIYADDFTAIPAMTGKAATIETTMKTYERDKANPAKADKVTHEPYMITCSPLTATITHRNPIWTPNGAGGSRKHFIRAAFTYSKKGMANGRPLPTPAMILDEYAILGYMELDLERGGFETRHVRLDGDKAIVAGVNHVKGKDDKGVAYDRKIRFTDTWINAMAAGRSGIAGNSYACTGAGSQKISTTGCSPVAGYTK